MIITRTPFRISFVGGGSDIKDFYKHSPGAVLSTTINKYMYISSHYFFDEDKIRIKYSQTETVNGVEQLKHPIVREVLNKFHTKGALEISSNGDVPAGTGLGSSSSFTVSLLHNLHSINGKFVSKKQLAEEACEIEINKLGEPIGKQDQYAAAFGGLNIIKFHPSGTVSVEPLHLPKATYEELQDNLLMFYTGVQREASTILSEQKKNFMDIEKFKIMQEMVSLVWKIRDALYEHDLDEFGRILHKNWMLKQKMASQITDQQINEIYQKGLENGALGGKLLGAGGGGFILFYCPKDKQGQMRSALSPLKELKFRFDQEGSKLIHIGDEYNEH